MYSEKFIVTVKHNGRVLREQGDTVLLPFGCEYTLSFKNLNSLRALVRVEVDGTDATQGTSLIVPANGTVDLERFLKAGNMEQGHRFKFIERTAKIEDGPRGIKAEDGLIRVEFEYEKMAPKVEYETIVKRTYIADPPVIWHGPYYQPTWCSTAASTGGPLPNAVNASHGALRSAVGHLNNISQVSSQNFADVEAATGITVPGSISEQKFSVGAWFPTDGQKHVMVLRLMGQVGETKVERPVTVKTKVVCDTCGTSNKHGTKFCRECGTSLSLL